MSEPDFSIPRRQELLGVLILFGENVRKLIRLVAALVFASIYMKNIPFSIPVIIGFGVIIMGVYTTLQYLRFKFHIEEGHLILERGVIQRERLSIPLERVQTVHLSQNVIQQLVQLTGVKIDTAGSGGEELKISALTRSDALGLQQILEKNKVESEVANGSETQDSEVKARSERRTLVHLSIGKLMIVGLTENHLRSGFIALGVVWGYYWQFEDFIMQYLGIQLEMSQEEIEQTMANFSMGMTFLLAGIVVFLVASVLISVVRVMLRNFGLKATLGAENLRVTSGLLKKNSYTIPLNKIQMLTWQGNFLRRIPGFESVSISQSRSTGEKGQSKVEIPACYKNQSVILEESLFKEELREGFHSYSLHWYYQVYYTVILCLLGIIPAVLLYLGQMKFQALMMLVVYMIVVVLWVWKYSGTVRLSTNGELIQFSRGWLFTSRKVLKVYKIQSVKMTQSIFQKRRGTAHLKLYTAGGSMSMRFMPENLVHQLHNYLLYKVEISKKSWM